MTPRNYPIYGFPATADLRVAVKHWLISSIREKYLSGSSRRQQEVYIQRACRRCRRRPPRRRLIRSEPAAERWQGPRQSIRVGCSQGCCSEKRSVQLAHVVQVYVDAATGATVRNCMGVGSVVLAASSLAGQVLVSTAGGRPSIGWGRAEELVGAGQSMQWISRSMALTGSRVVYVVILFIRLFGAALLRRVFGLGQLLVLLVRLRGFFSQLFL